MRRFGRALALILGNLAIFGVLFLLLEVGVRVHRDGFGETLADLFSRDAVPYSNLGRRRWVIYDEHLGYRLNPSQPGINRRSIRHDEISVPAPPGRQRLLVLGDSIPWDRPSFVDEVSSELTAEMINASVPGYTSYQELELFKRYLATVEPDLVIWAYCLNDNHKFLHRFDERGQMLFTPEAMASTKIHDSWDGLVNQSYVLSTFRAALIARRQAASMRGFEFPWEGRPDFNIAWKEYSWAFYESQLQEMVGLLEKRGARLALVVFPYEPQLRLRGKRTDREYILRPQHHLAQLCRRYQIQCLDLFPAFERAYDQGAHLYRDSVHLNPDGHHLAARELLTFLRENQLVSRPAGP